VPSTAHGETWGRCAEVTAARAVLVRASASARAVAVYRRSLPRVRAMLLVETNVCEPRLNAFQSRIMARFVRPLALRAIGKCQQNE